MARKAASEETRRGRGTTTSDATAAFFEELAARGREPMLRRATGTVRFDAVDGKRTERWFLTVEKGDIAVSRRNAAADCVVRADRTSFDRIFAGKQNVIAAALRGEVALQGDPKLLVLVQRLVPRPGRGVQRRRSSRRKT